MKRKPGADDVKMLLQGLQASVPRAECWSCDCLQGLVVQLELDARDDVAYLTHPLRVLRSEMHGCLGCVPCPLWAPDWMLRQDQPMLPGVC